MAANLESAPLAPVNAVVNSRSLKAGIAPSAAASSNFNLIPKLSIFVAAARTSLSIPICFNVSLINNNAPGSFIPSITVEILAIPILY